MSVGRTGFEASDYPQALAARSSAGGPKRGTDERGGGCGFGGIEIREELTKTNLQRSPTEREAPPRTPAS